MTSLAVVERHGFTFSSDHVAGAWVDNLSEEALSGAEKTAYRSLRSGIRPPRSAELAREEGEADGAMARAFLWGYLAPGDPGFAAELAWRDARVSHAGSGVYGAMFAAAAASAAFVCDDPWRQCWWVWGKSPTRPAWPGPWAAASACTWQARAGSKRSGSWKAPGAISRPATR